MVRHNHTDDLWWQDTFLEDVGQFGKITAATKSADITNKGRTIAASHATSPHGWHEALADFTRSGLSPHIATTAHRKED